MDLPIIDTSKVSIEIRNLIPKIQKERKNFIIKQLSELKGKSYLNKDLDIYIFITSDSIKEIAEYASKSYKTTISALAIVDIIKESKYIKTDKPKEGNQTKIFHFADLYILGCRSIETGKMKMTVGIRKEGKHLIYCISKLN